VPDFIVRTSDAETAAAAKLMGAVLWDDLEFEREFYMVPRDTYKTIPAAKSFSEIAFDRWRELGADGLVIGSVERTAPGTFRVEVRLFDVRTRRSVMAKEYTGTAANPRLYAHTASDDIHLQQRALRGAARSRLTFSSDRDGERVSNSIQPRDVKEIYISDYDGANQRRVTVTRKLNILVSPRLPRHLRVADLPGHARESHGRTEPELAARLVAGREPHLLHVHAGRQLGVVRDGP
jgi:Tol biopolymer transport system component